MTTTQNHPSRTNRSKSPAALNRALPAAAFLLATTAAWHHAHAVGTVTWIGGNGTWSDTITTGWSGADEPDFDDTALFNTASTISLGTNNSVSGLTVSASADLDLNGSGITVD